MVQNIPKTKNNIARMEVDPAHIIIDRLIDDYIYTMMTLCDNPSL
jgi:hypothetical protein